MESGGDSTTNACFGEPSVDDLSGGADSFNGFVTPPRLHRSQGGVQANDGDAEGGLRAPGAPRKRKGNERPESELLLEDEEQGQWPMGDRDTSDYGQEEEADGVGDADGERWGVRPPNSRTCPYCMAPISSDFEPISPAPPSAGATMEDESNLVLGQDWYWENPSSDASDEEEGMDES